MNRLIKSTNTFSSLRTLGGVRRMGGGHGGPPPTGWEAAVRKALPHDHQIVLATLGMYTTLFLVAKLIPSSKKKAEKTGEIVASDASSTIPSIMDDSFDEWSKIPGNMEKWEKSLDDMNDFEA